MHSFYFKVSKSSSWSHRSWVVGGELSLAFRCTAVRGDHLRFFTVLHQAHSNPAAFRRKWQSESREARNVVIPQFIALSFNLQMLISFLIEQARWYAGLSLLLSLVSTPAGDSETELSMSGLRASRSKQAARVHV